MERDLRDPVSKDAMGICSESLRREGSLRLRWCKGVTMGYMRGFMSIEQGGERGLPALSSLCFLTMTCPDCPTSSCLG